jgi:hypothetical protein
VEVGGACNYSLRGLRGWGIGGGDWQHGRVGDPVVIPEARRIQEARNFCQSREAWRLKQGMRWKQNSRGTVPKVCLR